MELQMSACQRKKTHLKQGKSGAFRAWKLCHFWSKWGTLSPTVCMCVCVRFTDFTVYLLPAASPALCEQEAE